MSPLLRLFGPLIRYLVVCGVLCLLCLFAMPDAERHGCLAGWVMLAAVYAGAGVVLWRTEGTLVVVGPPPDDHDENL